MLLHYSIYVICMILLAFFFIHINAIIKAITYELKEHSEKRLVANTISHKPICLFLSSSPIKGIDKMQKGRQSDDEFVGVELFYIRSRRWCD